MMADDAISDEDKALFRAAVANVTPLGKPTRSNQLKSPAPKPPSSTESTNHVCYDLSSYYAEEVASETILKFSRADIPKKRMKALSQGEIRWQARLDLHGFTVESAKIQLCNFITQQLQQDHRHLLIIHGKGGAQGGAPILKNLVYHWLKQLPEVLALHSAAPGDGGAGALYVLLKRQRSG